MIARYVFTDQVKQAARAYQANILGVRHIATTPNYTGLEAPDRFVTGYLGEWSYKQYLDENKIPYIHQVRDDGIPDTGDFIIYGKVHNVKANLGDHPNMLVSVEQTKRHHADWYVAVNIIGEYGCLYGCMSSANVLSIRPKTWPRLLNHVAHHSKLIPLMDVLRPAPYLCETFGEFEQSGGLNVA